LPVKIQRSSNLFNRGRIRIVEFGGMGDSGMVNYDRLERKYEHSNRGVTYIGLGNNQFPQRLRRDPIRFVLRTGSVRDFPYPFRESSIDEMHFHMVSPANDDRLIKPEVRSWGAELLRVLKPGGKVFLTTEMTNGLFRDRRFHSEGFDSDLEVIQNLTRDDGFTLSVFALGPDGLSSNLEPKVVGRKLVVAGPNEGFRNFHWFAEGIHSPRNFRDFVGQFTGYPLLVSMFALLRKPK